MKTLSFPVENRNVRRVEMAITGHNSHDKYLGSTQVSKSLLRKPAKSILYFPIPHNALCLPPKF